MFFAMFDGWAQALKAERPKLNDAALRQFRDRMYGGDFVFNVSREFVRSCRTPMLILCGNDDYHPKETSKEIAALAPNAELVEHWKASDVIDATVKRVREFLISHTPKS
jgi:pimeloyl-ACP methyl ester carboxylesterase